MADREPLDLPTLGLETVGYLRNRRFLTGNHHRLRTIHRSHTHPLPQTLQQRQHLILGSLERHHRPTRRQRLHQPAASRDQSAGVLQ
ncbi:hypothetical protein GCM10012285_51860 [Streptomyces kronopolitis]|uniref:Uncharacterized protein n=1 Tax=Streptomyces kronopolitis TaxID=1612435 RepID=A0ABQ2JWC1_9ACTN|nr:hypothetical protein GCM10012285_51860 [Streptomyces kronopolitis]